MTRALVFIAVLVLMTAACGGDSSSSSGVASIEDVTTTVTTGDKVADELEIDEEAVLGFAACMRDEGIDFPDPVVDTDGNVGFDLLALRDLTNLDETELESAFEECASYLEGVTFGFDQIFDAEFQDDLLAFSVCMRDNGFDMPDPDFANLTSSGRLYPEFDVNDPDFDSAFETCRDTLPGIPGIANTK